MSIVALNLAAGKFDNNKDLGIDADFLVNVDTMYYDYLTPVQIEQRFDFWNMDREENDNPPEYLKCKTNAFDFMSRTSLKFDLVICYRFLEHVKRTDVLYFIYLISTCLKKGGEVDIIVPNYLALANMIIVDEPGSDNWEAQDILLTTELLNEPDCPHASVWTSKRLEYFFELEKRFETVSIDDTFNFDGRDIYLRYRAKKI